MSKALHDSVDRLVTAIVEDDVETMQAILDRNSELLNATTDLDRRLRPSDTRAMHLIHLAVAEDRLGVARLLIERGADLNVRNADGRLPLHDCFELGRNELAAVLLAAGAEADVCAAAAYGMHDRLREILKARPALANDLETGISPLGWCAYGNQPESARILFDYGAVIDHPPYNAQAWGPVAHVANTAFARLLLEFGGDPSGPNETGDTPLHIAIKSRIVADPTAFIEMLLASGANRAIRNHAGRTALDEALLQAGSIAETYFPARPLAPKSLERTIELLRL